MSQAQKNKRRHSRIPLKVHAELSSKKSLLYTGYSKDFSFGGMYLHCDKAVYLPSKHILSIKIIFGQGDDAKSVELYCRCVRTDKGGFAVQFNSIRRDHYELLKEVIRKQVDDPDALFEETTKVPPFTVDE